MRIRAMGWLCDTGRGGTSGACATIPVVCSRDPKGLESPLGKPFGSATPFRLYSAGRILEGVLELELQEVSEEANHI